MKRPLTLATLFLAVIAVPFSNLIAARQCADVGPGGRRCDQGERWSNRICACVPVGPESKVALCHVPEEAVENDDGSVDGHVIFVSPSGDTAHRLKHRDCDAPEGSALHDPCSCGGSDGGTDGTTDASTDGTTDAGTDGSTDATTDGTTDRTLDSSTDGSTDA